MLPLLEPVAVDRLAHLLGACGAHAAPVLVEGDALRLEFQPAERQQPPYAPFQVLHHVLVQDPQHSPGQHRIPVTHELEVSAVVTRDVLDAVGELLAVGEQLLEVAEAAGHRLAPCIDDACVRQHEVYQTDVPEIVRHLVDEVRLAGAVDTGLAEVVRSQLAQVLGTQALQDARIARLVRLGPKAAQAADELLHVGQLLGALDLRVRGQDLLEERRARARQPDDENRVGARIPVAGAGGEELARADLDLVFGVALDELGAVAAFGALERIAEPVLLEGRGELARIFQRLAERKVQVVAIDEPGGRGRDRTAHARQLLAREAVGLEVGEAPVRVPEIRPARGSAAVGLDGWLRLPEGLEGVRDRQVRLGILPVTAQQLAVERNRALMVAESHPRAREQHLQGSAARVVRHELLDLGECFLVAVQLGEDERVLVARRLVVGRALEHRGEQHLGIEVDLVRDADARQQPHRLDVIAVLEEVGPDQRLGRLEITVGEETGAEHHVLRQRAQRRHVARRQGGVRRLALHAVQAFEHAPAARQRMVDVDRLEECIDRRLRLAQRHEAAAALLVETAELRMMLLEAGQGCEGLGYLPAEALRNGRAQQRLAVAGRALEHRLGGGEHLVKAVLAQELMELGADGARVGGGVARRDRVGDRRWALPLRTSSRTGPSAPADAAELPT